MTGFSELPMARRVQLIEEALAKALNYGDFEVRTHDGERYLAPILVGHVAPEAVSSIPLMSLDRAAREIERLLS